MRLIDKIKRGVAVAGAWCLAATSVASAQDNTGGGSDIYGSSKLQNVGQAVYGGSASSQSLPQIIGTVVQAFIALIGLIFLVLLVYAGYLWMMARGDEKQVEKAKDTIQRAIIGIIIVTAAYAISSFVISRLVSSCANPPC